jgi:hypothetical protein
LVDCSREVSDDRLLQALDHLERAGRIPPTPVLDSALLTLSRRPSRTAAENRRTAASRSHGGRASTNACEPCLARWQVQ